MQYSFGHTFTWLHCTALQYTSFFWMLLVGTPDETIFFDFCSLKYSIDFSEETS